QNLSGARRHDPLGQVEQELAAKMATVDTVISKHFPEALDTLKACLAVVAVSCMRRLRHCLGLILVANSGSGKTMPFDFIMPSDDTHPLNANVYRSDNFTAKAFVTHRADIDGKRAQDIDLL